MGRITLGSVAADYELSALHIAEDLSEFTDDKICFLRHDDPPGAQHSRMRDASLYVLSV